MGISSITINRATNSFDTDIKTDTEQFPTMTSKVKTVSNDFKVKTLHTVADMAGFEAQWRDLEDRSAKPSNVFQSFDWCINWARTNTFDNDCYSLHIVTVSRNDECLLIWPMMTTCVGPFCVLRWLSDPFSQYGDALVIAGDETDSLLQLAWQELNNHPSADSIRLRHVRRDANVFSFLTANAKDDGCHNHAPYLDLAGYPTQAAYDARYSKSQRRRRKKIRAALAKNGEISFTHTNKGQAFDKSLEHAIAEKRHWLNQRGLHSKPLQSNELGTFFRALAENGKTLKPLASQLNAGEREISYEIGLRYKNHHFGYLTAHDSNLTDASPARLHMDLSQRLAIDDGMAAFDLMVPADPHKKTWSNNSVEAVDFFAPINRRGSIYTYVYLQVLRPLVRTVYKTLPAQIRRHITRWI